MKSRSVTIEMKADEQCFPAVLFIMLLKGAPHTLTTRGAGKKVLPWTKIEVLDIL